MIKFNICKKMEYISQGQKKTFWETVGSMVEFQKEDGSSSRIIEIPAIGLKANVFEQISKSSKTKKAEAVEVGDEEVNPEDLPF